MSEERIFTHVGWSLGNYCPFRCKHCYSEWVRDSDTGLSRENIESICEDLASLKVRHVTLGGNEPFFTNGPRKSKSLLPYIIRTLYRHGIACHLVSSGPSVILLAKADPTAFAMLASVNLSCDSPIAAEHNANRGADLYSQLQLAAKIAISHDVRRILLYCAMDWNFDIERISGFFEMARNLSAHPRINAAKPIVKGGAVVNLLGAQKFWSGFDYVTNHWPTQVVTEPPLRLALGLEFDGPSCGTCTFRISSTDAEGSVKLSGCTYVHSSRIGLHPKSGLVELARRLKVNDCGDCLARLKGPGWEPESANLLERVPDWRTRTVVASDLNGAFEGYLCTWIGARSLG